jgi:hypothetical protein
MPSPVEGTKGWKLLWQDRKFDICIAWLIPFQDPEPIDLFYIGFI